MQENPSELTDKWIVSILARLWNFWTLPNSPDSHIFLTMVEGYRRTSYIKTWCLNYGGKSKYTPLIPQSIFFFSFFFYDKIWCCTQKVISLTRIFNQATALKTSYFDGRAPCLKIIFISLIFSASRQKKRGQSLLISDNTHEINFTQNSFLYKPQNAYKS